MTGEPLVYYLRRNGLIKIGFTRHLAERMRVLRPDELLAVEPGNLRLESGRHIQFRAFHVTDAPGTEWFAPEPELLAHVAAMASLYPIPDLPRLAPRRPGPRSRGRLGRSLAVPAEELAALATYDALVGRDLSTVSSAELLANLRATELVAASALGWSGRCVAALKTSGQSWSQIVRATSTPQSTLIRRSAPYLDGQS